MSVVLFLSANGSDDARLAVSREARQAREAMRAVDRSAFDFRAESDVEPDELVALVQQYQPTVLHFSGHGEPDGRLVVQGGIITPSVLATVVASCPRIRLVVLNACYSDETARVVAKHVPVVIGIAKAVEDDAARAFSRQLYVNLARGDAVQAAFDAAAGALAATQSVSSAQAKLKEQTLGAAARLVLRRQAPEIRAVFEHTANGRPKKGDRYYYRMHLYVHDARDDTSTVVYQLDPEYEDATEEGAFREITPTAPQFRTWIQTEGDFLVRATIWRGRKGLAVDAYVTDALRRHYAGLSEEARGALDMQAIEGAIADLKSNG